jgi:biotin synthase
MIPSPRIIKPNRAVRLSAGSNDMSVLEQAFCFMAGANSIFAGDKLLTTPNPDFKDDMAMFELLGLKTRKAFKNGRPNELVH